MPPGGEVDADVLAVRAGLAGLAAADQLTKEGRRALVLERDAEPGGRARSEEWEGCTIELGATFVTPAYRRLRRLISECGLDDRLAPMPNAIRTAIRRDGCWHHVDFRRPEIELARYGGISWREKASLARLAPRQLRVATSARFFDLASVAAVDSGMLEGVVGPAANRYFAAATLEVFCGCPAEEVSLAFGVLAARYPTRRMWVMQGGLGALTGELARRVGVRCGVGAEKLKVEADHVVVETSAGETLRARSAILATRAHEAHELWPQAPDETRRFLAGQTYSQGFGVFLRTSAPVRRLDPRAREILMDIVPSGEGTEALLAVTYLNDSAPDGGLVALGASPRAAAADLDDAELAERLESEFVALHPELEPQVIARRTLRWPVFVPAYPAGRARELAAFRARLAPGPVQIAGDYLYGPLMEAAVQAGQEARAPPSIWTASRKRPRTESPRAGSRRAHWIRSGQRSRLRSCGWSESQASAGSSFARAIPRR